MPRNPKPQFIAYVGRNEVIVTTPNDENQMLEEFFGPDMGRDVDDYDRLVSTDVAVHVRSGLRAD